MEICLEKMSPDDEVLVKINNTVVTGYPHYNDTQFVGFLRQADSKLVAFFSGFIYDEIINVNGCPYDHIHIATKQHIEITIKGIRGIRTIKGEIGEITIV